MAKHHHPDKYEKTWQHTVEQPKKPLPQLINAHDLNPQQYDLAKLNLRYFPKEIHEGVGHLLERTGGHEEICLCVNLGLMIVADIQLTPEILNKEIIPRAGHGHVLERADFEDLDITLKDFISLVEKCSDLFLSYLKRLKLPEVIKQLPVEFGPPGAIYSAKKRDRARRLELDKKMKKGKHPQPAADRPFGQESIPIQTARQSRKQERFQRQTEQDPIAKDLGDPLVRRDDLSTTAVVRSGPILTGIATKEAIGLLENAATVAALGLSGDSTSDPVLEREKLPSHRDKYTIGRKLLHRRDHVQPHDNALQVAISQLDLHLKDQPNYPKEFEIFDAVRNDSPTMALSPYTNLMLQSILELVEMGMDFRDVIAWELACGRGYAAILLAKLKAKVISTDFFRECTEATKANAAANGINVLSEFPSHETKNRGIYISQSDMLELAMATQNPDSKAATALTELIFMTTNLPQVREQDHPRIRDKARRSDAAVIDATLNARHDHHINRNRAQGTMNPALLPAIRRREGVTPDTHEHTLHEIDMSGTTVRQGIYGAGQNGRQFVKKAMHDYRYCTEPGSILTIIFSSMSDLNAYFELAELQGYNASILCAQELEIRPLYRQASGVDINASYHHTFADYLRECEADESPKVPLVFKKGNQDTELIMSAALVPSKEWYTFLAQFRRSDKKLILPPESIDLIWNDHEAWSDFIAQETNGELAKLTSDKDEVIRLARLFLEGDFRSWQSTTASNKS